MEANQIFLFFAEESIRKNKTVELGLVQVSLLDFHHLKERNLQYRAQLFQTFIQVYKADLLFHFVSQLFS